MKGYITTIKEDDFEIKYLRGDPEDAKWLYSERLKQEKEKDENEERDLYNKRNCLVYRRSEKLILYFLKECAQ